MVFLTIGVISPDLMCCVNLWLFVSHYDHLICNALVILSLAFHPSFKQCCPLGSSYLVGKVKYKFIEFFVFDYDSLPYLLCFTGRRLLLLLLLLIKLLVVHGS